MTIHSGLNEFVLLDTLTLSSETESEGRGGAHPEKEYLILEALAQLCSHSQRWRLNFSLHTFLLQVKNWRCLPICQTLNLKYTALLKGEAARSWLFQVAAFDEIGCEIAGGEILIGATEYSEEFQEDLLKKHYKEVISCLMNA